MLGPAGMAQFGQLRSVTASMTTASLLGLNNAFTQEMVACDSKAKRDAKFNELLSIVLFIGLLQTLLIVLFLPYLTQFIFGTSNAPRYIMLVLCCTSFSFSISQFLLLTFNAFNKQEYFSLANSSAAVLQLLLIGALYLLIDSDAPFIFLATSQSVVLVAAIYFSYRAGFRLQPKLITTNFFFALRKCLFFIRRNSGFVIMALAGIVAATVAPAMVRNDLIKFIGIEKAGEWQSLYQISEIYLGFFATALAAYFYPKLIKVVEGKNISISFFITECRWLYMLMAAGFGIFSLFFDQLYPMIFSRAFLAAKDYLLIQLLADFFKVASWTFGYYMITKRATAFTVIATFISAILWVTLNRLLIQYFSIQQSAASLSLLAANFAFLIMATGYYTFDTKRSTDV